jgi:hypothetical protein
MKNEVTPIKKARTPIRRKSKEFDRLWKPWAAAAGCSAVIATAIWGVGATRAHLRLTEAEAQIKKGFTALAAETIDPVRNELTTSPRGCTALMGSYFGAHRADRLEWAAQACITAGVETTDTYIGLAAAKELVGRDGEALQLLQQVTQKFTKSPDPLYRIAQILRRNKKEAEAADVLLKATEIAPDNNQLAMETMEQLSTLQRWSDARHLADKIKAVETDNPEVKLLIARALLKGGDAGGAQTVVAQARTLLEKKPEMKGALERAYGDVLNGGGNAQQPPLPPGKVAEGPQASAEASRGLASPPQPNGTQPQATLPKPF